MILDIGIFIVVVAVFYAACFFAICLAMALVGLVGYLLIGLFKYVTSPGFRHDVHTLLGAAVLMGGRGIKRGAEHVANGTVRIVTSAAKVIFHPVTTLRGERKTPKYVVSNASRSHSTRDGSSWIAGVEAATV